MNLDTTSRFRWLVGVLCIALAGTAAAQQQTAGDYVSRAHDKQNAGDLAGAIADFDRALEMQPKVAGIYCDRAAAKQEKGDLDGAIADYDHAIAIDPNSADTYGYRALAKGTKNDVDGAIADHTRAIELDPTLASSYADRGLDKLAKGDLTGATADCEKAVSLDQNSPDAWRDRGIVNQVLNRWPQALADYRRYCDLAMGRGDYARFYIWVLSARLGQKEVATKELAGHLDEIPKTEAEAWTRSVAGFLVGSLPEADFFALAHAPDEQTERGQRCEAFYFAGMKKLIAGDKAGAAEDFRQCLATKRVTFTEYEFAKAELKALAP